MSEYKSAFKFIKPHISYIIIMIIFLLGVQYTSFVTPFIIQKLVDDNLLKPQSYIIEKESGFNINGITYEYTKSNTDSQIVNIENNYYVVYGEVHKEEIVLNDEKLMIDDNQIDYHLMTTKEVKDAFGPMKYNIVILSISLLIVSLLGILFTYLKQLSASLLSCKVARDVRIKAMENLACIKLDFIEKEPAGKLANRVLNDSSGAAALYISTINVIFSLFLSVCFAYYGLFKLNANIATYCLIIIPIMILWGLLFSSKIKKIVTKTNESNSLMIGKTNEIINGISILKIFGKKDTTINKFDILNMTYIKQMIKEQKFHLTIGWNGLYLFQEICGGIIIIVFCILYLNNDTQIMPGMINAFYLFIIRIISPFGSLFHEIGNIENSRVKVNRINMIFDAEKEDYFLEDVKPFLGKVEFKNLAHNYGGIKALNNVNFKVYSGQKIALVGHSGSGKSTLMNILLRFVDHTGGDIYIDDINICEYSKRTYRKNIGIILQTPILFAGTIYDNISYSKNISKKEAVNLLVKVGGENLLSKCSKGIDTVLSRSGNNLSLGEKQLISFARILAYNPSILVLDEATANIDTETEEIFSKALEVISENKTLFVIAHRISTIKDSDNIIVLKNGEIIESGTHNSLLENKGYYSEMCQYNL